ncbi:MAG: protein translocase subunit SecF [Anaerolineae bacterium]|nr:protein translocase subunit SecF [Anaerolineae bacterium]
MLDILGKRYIFFALSLVLIIPGLIIMIVKGLPLSIDFRGGSLMEVSFASGTLPSTDDVLKTYNDQGVTDAQVTTTENSTLIIRSSFMSDEVSNAVVNELETVSGGAVNIIRLDSVGPTIGQEVAGRAGLAVAMAAIAVIIYITFAFRGIPNAFRYGVCAIIAMAHDVLVVISLVSIGGILFGWQVDALFLTALLSVIGFSVQDKVVVFDRIRENSGIFRKLEFEKLVNHSIVQTLQRSINTQLMTVEYMLLALALFGGVTLREFAVILLVGLFMGTYSSIFIAAPSLVIWETGEWKRWFRKSTATA